MGIFRIFCLGHLSLSLLLGKEGMLCGLLETEFYDEMLIRLQTASKKPGR